MRVWLSTRAIVVGTLWRNSIRLLLTFLAAFVTWLLVWYTQAPKGNLIEEDCAVKDADGKWQFPVPCPK